MPHDLFIDHTTDTAPDGARTAIEATRKKFGFVPTPVARMATSPELLKGFLTVNAVFEQSTLAPLDREVLVMTVATRNGCHVCVAMHTAELVRLQASSELVEALRARAPLPEARLEALRLFTLAVMDHRGAVPDQDTRAFLDAGHTPRNALEVVLGVGAYTISTYANRLTAAPVDAQLQAFAWDGDAA
ncbi:carboxymuconolactone decarboxylase family protein [Sphaerisporangium perillae]|uniref:carboxymuconolactone decarboxylase family protein n=1 Tax=Sphaerisporangium perillae TaxID=2935860 RepID=UPI00200E5B31|nr:carboxymuconolactone decarboxylase family protein [Sphaerisporangium perillae]